MSLPWEELAQQLDHLGYVHRSWCNLVEQQLRWVVEARKGDVRYCVEAHSRFEALERILRQVRATDRQQGTASR